jgi:predicted ATPase
MHLEKIYFASEKFPEGDLYPFNLDIFRRTRGLIFKKPVTYFIGENGTGKSTLLQAIALKCGIYIWQGPGRMRYAASPYENMLNRVIDVVWTNSKVPGSFFDSQLFRNFTQLLDEWAVDDPGVLEYFGGKSLIAQSHGQSLMAFFQSRFKLKGLYFLDEPETALSPKSQLALLKLLKDMGDAGKAQFIVATHSPMLLACPDAEIISFDDIPLKTITYEDTDYYRIYKNFMENPSRYLKKL